MSDFPIEKGVEIPKITRVGSGGNNRKYPWNEMEIGDSFFVPGANARQFGTTSQASKRTGKRFTMRTVEGGVRVWRIE